MASAESAATVAEQCKPAVLQQEATPTEDKSLPLESKQSPQRAELQAPTCPSPDAVCKPVVQEAAVPATVAKPETPTSTAPAAASSPAMIASIAADSSQKVAASPDVTQPLTIDPSEQHAEMLLTASEVSTVSPVPIQVAESVLQAEPKESVSGAAVRDQAIATTVTAVHESTNVAATTAEPAQLNGSAGEFKERGDVKPDAPAEATKEPVRDAPSDIPVATAEKMETGSGEVPPKEPTSVTAERSAEPARTPTAEVARIAGAAEAKAAEQIARTETMEEKPPVQVAQTESTEAKPVVPPKVAAAAAAAPAKPQEVGEAESPIVAKAPLSMEPMSSAAAKELNIPSTPTVIEATPPVSPLAESAQELEEKAAKKSLKKSDSAEGTEAEGEDKRAKKTAKKTVKKTKAKPEETAPSTTESATAAESSSQGKAKKSAKVTKKTGLKSGQSLETDTSVPETPPPLSPGSTAAPEVPVPPKRKTKGSNSGGTTSSAKGAAGKKPEAEE